MRKRWLAASYDKDLAAQIAEEHSLNPIAALLAVIRGLRDYDEIEDFFDPEPFFTLDPFDLPDMDKAVGRISRAIDNFECISIFGDFDADGVTSTALLYTYLESKGANVLWYIPDRLTEGYGLSVGAVERLKDMGTQLIVTVDNGVSAADATERAYELGMEVVITDHHKVPDVLPHAEAIVDLQRADCSSPFKQLCGAGVAFKLACAMELEDDTAVIGDFAACRVKGFSTRKKMRFVYQLLYRAATMYQQELRLIDRRRQAIEKNLAGELKDSDLMELHGLESTLVYFATSLRANATVLDRLTRYKRLEQYPDDRELLDDVIVEIRQAIEMTSIYRDDIKGTRELFSSILDNRLNNAMKYLTSITLLMAVPTVISGLYGMNVQSDGMPFANTTAGFAIVLGLTLALCVFAAWVLHKKHML